MATCPECEADVDVDDFDVDRGDTLSCPDCTAMLEVVSLSPIELDLVPQDQDEDEAAGSDDLDDSGDDGWEE